MYLSYATKEITIDQIWTLSILNISLNNLNSFKINIIYEILF